MQGNDACCINWTSGPLLLLLKRLTVWKHEKIWLILTISGYFLCWTKIFRKILPNSASTIKNSNLLKIRNKLGFHLRGIWHIYFYFTSLIFFHLRHTQYLPLHPCDALVFFFKPKDHLGRYTTQPILRSTLQSRIGQLLY